MHNGNTQAEGVTVTVEKGDILGLLMMTPVAVAVLWLLGMIVMGIGLGGGWPKLKEWAGITLVLAFLAVVGWLAWEAGHWFTR